MERYDTKTITLHWLTAGLTATLWVMGQTADWIPRGPVRSSFWSLHVVLGFALAVVLVWRVVWRGTGGRVLRPMDRGALHHLATGTHVILYVLVVGAVGLGVINAFVRGFAIFGLFHLPQIGDSEWRRPITEWHGRLADMLLILALFHAAAALIHHYVWRDGLLGRMVPAAAAPPRGDPR